MTYYPIITFSCRNYHSLFIKKEKEQVCYDLKRSTQHLSASRIYFSFHLRYNGKQQPYSALNTKCLVKKNSSPSVMFFTNLLKIIYIYIHISLALSSLFTYIIYLQLSIIYLSSTYIKKIYSGSKRESFPDLHSFEQKLSVIKLHKNLSPKFEKSSKN